jgi:hypothetical protein
LAGLPAIKRVGAAVITPPRKFVLPSPVSALSEGWSGVQVLRRQLLRTRTWMMLPWQMDNAD